MKHIIISGTQDSGKTTVVIRLKNLLIEKGYEIITIKDENEQDFLGLLYKNEKLILINSFSDTEYYIKRAKELIESNEIHIMITAIRNYSDSMRSYMKEKLNLCFLDEQNANENNYYIEIPLAKVTKRYDKENAIEWYNKKIVNLISTLISYEPYKLF